MQSVGKIECGKKNMSANLDPFLVAMFEITVNDEQETTRWI